ncbi:MAG: MaoC family dehydratase [Gammaproteobacteria bacterium]|nr:MaoC family dehydratase [Gammaproteobacteria bacterium]
MKVIEFIRKKSGNFQQNNVEFIAKLEPKFRNWSDLLNHRISNTLNNPWISRFNPSQDESRFGEPDSEISAAANKTYRELQKRLGEETFLGEWSTVDQNCINQFAEITGDKQWIHTDPERAKAESPFKSTIAHGFLTLALIPALTKTVTQDNNPYPDTRMVVNYGLNQVRFPFPVKAGARVRARIRLVALTPMKRSIEVVNEVSIEVEDRNRPACVAETVLRLYF